jgi:hypothetical protein
MSRLDKPAASAALTRHPPPYRALRMAAEWASAVRDCQLNFAYDPGTGHMVLHNAGTGPTLPVLTRSFTSRPRVKEVEFSVPSELPAAGISPPILKLSGDKVSALFWSESAVEKFLVPFYASIAADDAPRFLDRLFDAWYGYPADAVQVCAIALLLGRRPPAENTPLSLARTVGLVCLEGGTTLRLRTLDEFTERYATGLPRGGGFMGVRSGRPEVRPGWGVANNPESVVARDVAEFVSGMRGHFVAFTNDGTTLVPEVCAGESPPPLPEATVFTALARPVRPDRPVPSGVTLWVKETSRSQPQPFPVIPVKGEPPVEFRPDSVFWTDGSVEKLLLPYYASVKGGASWFFQFCLMAKWDGLMDPCSFQPQDVGTALAARVDHITHPAGRTDAEPPPSTVYATIHLPRSEYADDAAATVLLSVRDGDPAAHAVWLRQGGAASPAKRSRKAASRATEARKAGRSAR